VPRSVAAALGLGLAAACAPATRAPGPPGAQLATPTYTATEAAFAANIDPLNGLPSADPDVGLRAPTAFAVEDDGAVEVQGAEMIAEGPDGVPGLTALTLVDAAARPTIGPLGPAGWRDAAVARAFGAALVAGSAPAAIIRALGAAGVPFTALVGASAPPAEAAGADPARAPRWTYALGPHPAARPARHVAIGPGDARPSWRYDEVFAVWRRESGGRAFLDGGTGEGLTATNVLVLEVPGNPEAPDWWTGRGRALLMRGGTAVDATWVRAAPDASPALLDPDGMAAALEPGSTWIHFVADLGSVGAAP